MLLWFTPFAADLSMPATSDELTSPGEELESQLSNFLQELHDSDLVVGDRRSEGAGNSKLAQYNTLAEKLAARRRSPYPDPITLPVEIFIAIIKEAVAYDDATSMEAVLRLTLLSDSWRVALLQIPDLWTEISIEDRYIESSELPAQIHLGVTLTLKRPITLAIDHDLRKWTSILPLLTPHTHRIRRILVRPPTMYETIRTDDAFSWDFDDIIYSLGPLHALEDLTVCGDLLTSIDQWKFLVNMPSLRYITETRAPFSRLVAEPGTHSHLRILYSEVTAVELLKHRSQLHNLEELSSTEAYGH
ncbi:hypothetical protein PIIN_08915, partial [Serendipita indica DSM 11827]